MFALIFVIIIYFLVVISVGIYFTRRASENYSDFMIGSRNIGPWASTFSMVSSFASGYTYTGAPGLAYTQGWGSLWYSVGEAPANSLGIGLLGRRLRRATQLLDAISIPEFYEKHFASPALRVLTSIILLSLVSMYLVAQWVASGTLLSVILGIDYLVSLLIVATIVLLYTVLGGYLAVIYTDSLQLIIIFFGTVIFFGIALSQIGGLAALNDELAAVNPDFVTPWGPDLIYYGVFAALTPVLILALSGFGLPHVVARHISLQSARAARQAMLIAATIVVILSPAYFAIGLFGLAILGPGVENQEQIAFQLWLEVLPPVFAGVLASAALAAIMSTASSFLILLITTVGHDIFYRFLRRDSSERHRIRVSRLSGIILAIITFAVAINPPGLVFEIVVAALGAFALSFGVTNIFTMFWRRTTKEGAISCMVLSLIVFVGLSLAGWSPLGLNPFILGLFVAIAAIVLGSLISGNPRTDQLVVFDKAAGYGSEGIPSEIRVHECGSLSSDVTQALKLVHGSCDGSHWTISSLISRPANG